MGIKRYFAVKDTTIANFFQANLQTRTTGSNFGGSDILEVFSIFAQANSGSLEASRVLIQFPTDIISSDRTLNTIPVSGSVNFFLKLFNAPHGESVPRNFVLNILPISSSWTEGEGLDLEEGTDLSVNGVIGANWLYAGSSSLWVNQGGDYISASYAPGTNLPGYTQTFVNGYEELEVDITSLVEEWIAGTAPNYGVGIHLTSSQESGSVSYYTKKFFGRGSEFFFMRPCIEARWNGAKSDDRGKVVISSSLLTAADNLNTLFLYNYVNGVLKNIPNIAQGNPIYVQFWTSGSGGAQIITSPTPITGGWSATGIYTASFAINTTASILYDRWYSGSNVYYTGSFEPMAFSAMGETFVSNRYVINITNLRTRYQRDEKTRFRVFTRFYDWNPAVYSIATQNIKANIHNDIYYKVYRMSDKLDVIKYGTGSLKETKLSYDVSGSYFDVDMTLFEPGYTYGIKFVFNIDGRYEEIADTYKFKVEEIIDPV